MPSIGHGNCGLCSRSAGDIYLPQRGTADAHHDALSLRSHIHGPQELRLMLMMAAFQLMSDIYLPLKERLLLMLLTLSPRSHIFWSQEVLLMLVIRVPPIGHGNCG